MGTETCCTRPAPLVGSFFVLATCCCCCAPATVENNGYIFDEFAYPENNSIAAHLFPNLWEARRIILGEVVVWMSEYYVRVCMSSTPLHHVSCHRVQEKVLFFAFLFDGWMESVHFARADTMIDFQISDRKIQDFKKPENSSGTIVYCIIQ